jgi:hypothetical protein
MSNANTLPENATTEGDAGLSNLQQQVQAEEQAEQEEAAKGERMKQQIMRDRGEVDEDAPPIYIEHDQYEFAFRPFPKKVKVWAENMMFDFIGFDEETLENSDRAEEFRSVKERTVEVPAEYAVDEAFQDEEFWNDWFDLEERMGIIRRVMERQDDRAGNRQ